MTDPSTKDRPPTREELERETRRLARIRHLRVVRDEGADPPSAPRRIVLPEPGHDPHAA